MSEAGGNAARNQSETRSGKERLCAGGSGQGRRTELPDERGRREDEGQKTQPRSVESRPLDPAAPAKRQTCATSARSTGGASSARRVGRGVKAEVVVPAAGCGQRAQTTMASAAQVLLARVEESEGLGPRLEEPLEGVAVGRCVRCKAEVNMEEITRAPPIGNVAGESRGEGGRTVVSEWGANKEFDETVGGAAATGSSPNIASGAYRSEKASTPKRPRSHEMSRGPSGALLVGDPAVRVATPAASASPAERAPASTLGIDGLSPAAGQQHNSPPRQRSGGGIERQREGIHPPTGTERRGSSPETTKRLLREALRVKRLLAAMDGDDAAASADDLREEDPEAFLAGLGLVELKPLSAKLVEALDRGPRPFLGDPAAAVSEPRTTRGLRDQVCVCARAGVSVCLFIVCACRCALSAACGVVRGCLLAYELWPRRCEFTLPPVRRSMEALVTFCNGLPRATFTWVQLDRFFSSRKESERRLLFHRQAVSCAPDLPAQTSLAVPGTVCEAPLCVGGSF